MTAKLSLGDSSTRISRHVHGTLDGRDVYRFVMRNAAGWIVEVSEYGATLLKVEVPDREGRIKNVCFGFSTLDEYESDTMYAGRVVGRVANRIRQGTFQVGDESFQLPRNHGDHVLHGGEQGLHQAFFQGEIIEGKEGQELRLTYTSPSGESGFPGEVEVEVDYSWKSDGSLLLEMRGKPDRETPLNFTHHPYWNLSGSFEQPINAHDLQVVSSNFAVVDRDLVPTGETESCRLTPMDFRFRRSVGHALPLLESEGYDHCLMLDRQTDGLMQAAHLLDPESGRNMTVWTNQSGLQFYTTPSLPGCAGGAICLEPHAPPGALHFPELGSLMVAAGEVYVHKTLYCFFETPA